MCRYRKSCLILVQLCIVVVCKAQLDYFESSTTGSENEDVDPHSFYYGKNPESEVSSQKADRSIANYAGSEVDSCEAQLARCKTKKMSTTTDIPDETLSRRLVGMLINRANFKKEGFIFIGRIDLEVSETELEALREFGAGRLSLREVDPILNGMLRVPDVNRIYEAVLGIKAQVCSYIYYHKEIIIGAVTLLYLYWKLRQVEWTFRKMLSIGIPIILVASFLMTWWKLIQEERIKHMVLQVQNMQVPAECQPDSLSWLASINIFSNPAKCAKYYEAMMKNPDFQVTPAQALTHMVANMFYEPIALSGKTISTFLDDVTANMPFWLSVPVKAIVCIGFIPALIFTAILLAGGSLNLGVGPFSFFSLRGPAASDRRRNQHHESTIDRRPIENIPNVTFNLHLPDASMFEITSSDRSHNVAIKSVASRARSEESNSLPLQNCESGESADQSNRPAIADTPEIRSGPENIKVTDSSRETDGSSSHANVNGDLASGDSTSTHKSNASEIKPDDPKVSSAVREPTKLESGSGDN